jgi:hypothetical protein
MMRVSFLGDLCRGRGAEVAALLFLPQRRRDAEEVKRIVGVAALHDLTAEAQRRRVLLGWEQQRRGNNNVVGYWISTHETSCV